MSALTLKKPERKIIEKNRRNQMKFLYSRLFSLIPPHIISKDGDQVANRVDRTIEYIHTLKTNLEMNKNKKDKLLSNKRSYQHTNMSNNVCTSLNIQIHNMTDDHDAILVTGLKTHSNFCNVVHFLDQYSTEVTHADFSSGGRATFHIRQKQIEAGDICKRLENLVGNTKESVDNTNALLFNEVDSNFSVWDFDLLY